MLSRSRHLYALCVFLLLVFGVLISSRSYHGHREQTEQIWYKPVNYPLNASEIKWVKERYSEDYARSEIALKDSKKKHEELTGNMIKHVQSVTSNTADGMSSVNSASTGNCVKREVKLSQTLLPVTGLVSFPGSGNTWIRHLIQQMTGIGTSSAYCDGSLKSRGFPHECERQRAKTICVKTHEARHFPMFKKIVLLVRNPYEALLSYANFAKAGHTGHPSKQVLIQASDKMFNHSLRWCVNLTRATIGKFKGPVHVVQYEKVKSDMVTELRSLATFLNANITDRDIVCTVKIQEGNYHRKTNDAQHIDLLRSVYDREKLLRLREGARTHEKILKEAYNIDLDLGGSVEKILFNSSKS